MSEPISLSTKILLFIAETLQVPLKGLTATIELLDQGGTVPFIARYRKEATGNLDEVQIRSIEEKLAYFRELESRRATILASIEEQGKLTDELKSRIEATVDKSELEDLYLPYKPKRRTKATIAREKGLEPLALRIWEQQPAETSIEEFAATFIDPEKSVGSVEEALEGARHIIAEMINENADFRKSLRQILFNEGEVVSRKSDDAVDEQGKFKIYYDYREPVRKIPSHRMLAIRRGESEKVLYFHIEIDEARPVGELKSKILGRPGEWTPHLELAIEDAYKRLLNASIQTEIRLELKQRSDAEAIKVFRENLANLLLAPPAGQIGVLGIDPGLRTGCKVAVVDETGKFLEEGVIYPHPPRNDTDGAARLLKGMIARHSVKAIAIGNGTASRETDAFVRGLLKQEGLGGIFSVTVSEAGASVYSASDIAREEFPSLDLTVRGAISIARRLQDPLSELVKVDPKSIGVGQYQHDVDQRQLQRSLDNVIESSVNRVGVDLNTASWALLRYVAGVTERTARNIVQYRDENGKFRSRKAIGKVPGIGPKSFEQAAGFLRIRGGDNPLDATAVHPESYPVVEQIASSLGHSVVELIQQPDLVGKVKREELSAGIYTLNDIIEELRKPGRDPRDQFVAPQFDDAVTELGDLVVGMKLEGVVTNVTRFGAFVDVGVHQDGLVHVSQLSNRFIEDPADAVKVGQIVTVQVLSIDTQAKRIALSMKALMEPVGRPQRRPKPAAKSKPPAKPTLDDKLASLAERWKRR